MTAITVQPAAAAPRAAMTFYTPTPTQSENDQFAVQQMHGTLPRFPWYHKADGSPVDPAELRPNNRSTDMAVNARSSSPIPLRPDSGAMARSERRSFIRACAAMVLGAKQGVEPALIIKTWWSDDQRAELILRAASNVASTANMAALQLNRLGFCRCWHRPRPRRGCSPWRPAST